MTLDLLSGNSDQPGVRRPTFAVDFGGGGAGGGLLGSVGLAPGLDDPWARSLIAITIEMGVAPFVDVAKLDLAADQQSPSVALDDQGTISLGYQDSDTELVFTATINAIEDNLRASRRIYSSNGGQVLSRMRLNQSYEQQSAGAIVSDLAGSAGVDTDIVENGVDFPFLVLDDRTNVYQHIATLAKKSGYVAYFTNEGKLYFGPFEQGQPAQTFTYGIDIFSLRVRNIVPLIGSATAIGQGAAGSEGAEAWSWLVKDPASVTGQSGDGPEERLLSDATLRSSEASQSAADGVAAFAQSTAVTGTIIVPGAPRVLIGSTIEISDAPLEAANGNQLVSWVSHKYSKKRGFITEIAFHSCAGGAAGGLGGL